MYRFLPGNVLLTSAPLASVHASVRDTSDDTDAFSNSGKLVGVVPLRLVPSLPTCTSRYKRVYDQSFN